MVRVKKVNNKAMLRMKGWILAGVVFAGGVVAYFTIKDKNETKNVSIVQENYDETSEENTVLKYVEVASKLEKLNIDGYLYDGKLPQDRLDSPDVINSKYEELLNNSRSYGNDLNKMSEYINDILYLKGQKDLIDKYMSAYGHDLIYKDFVEPLKEYAAKLYDLEDPSKIIFWQYALSMDDPYMVIYTESPNEFTGILGKDKVDFKEVIHDRKLLEGIYMMTELQNTTKESYSSRLKVYQSALASVTEYVELTTTNQKTN